MKFFARRAITPEQGSETYPSPPRLTVSDNSAVDEIPKDLSEAEDNIRLDPNNLAQQMGHLTIGPIYF